MTFGSAIKTSVQFIQSAAVWGLILLIIGVLLDVDPTVLWSGAPPPELECQGPTNPSGIVSRQQLAQLLTLPTATSKQELQALLNLPYCQLAMPAAEPLSNLSYAYPLEFDPQTWLIITYEGDRYSKYDFSFRDQ
jgi:hypothetical protein